MLAVFRGTARHTVCRQLWSNTSYTLIREWSSSVPLHRAPLNQVLAVRSREGKSRRDVLQQEQLENDYITVDGIIITTLEKKLGVHHSKTCERLFRVHRSRLFGEGYNPYAAAEVAVENQRWRSAYEEHLTTADVAIMTDPQNQGLLFYAGAKTDLTDHNQKIHLRRGLWCLNVALELGVLEAAIDLAKIELSKVSGRPAAFARGDLDSKSNPVTFPPRLLDFIRRSARAREDWRTMNLYLDYMLRKPQNATVMHDNYRLAVDLFAMVEPSTKAIYEEKPLDRIEQPWFLLQKAADSYYTTLTPGSAAAVEVQKAYVDALNAGRDKYHDPRAARMLIRTTVEVKPGSPKWVDLVTQSAMQGGEDSCFLLGYHYIRQEGWHSETRKGKTPSSRTGLWWIEASAAAARRYAEVVARRYLLLAVLMRENGFEKEAPSYLLRGQNALREFPVDGADQNIEWLQGYYDHWVRDDTSSTDVLRLEKHLVGLYPKENTSTRKAKLKAT